MARNFSVILFLFGTLSLVNSCIFPNGSFINDNFNPGYRLGGSTGSGGLTINYNPYVGGLYPYLYTYGDFTTYQGTANINHIIRLDTSGNIDTDFNIGAGGGAGFDSSVYRVALSNDGSGDIYVLGQFTTYNGTASAKIIRLNSDGTVDTGFNVGTGITGAGNGPECLIAAVDGSGDIYVTGEFSIYDGTASIDNLMRINSDGTLDTGFVTGTGFDSNGFEIVPLTDGSGSIYVGGNFTQYNGTVVNGLTRIKSTGAIDPSFSFAGVGFNDIVHSIAIADDGSGDIYVVGDFTTFNGAARSRIIRLNSDGTEDAGFAIGAGFTGGSAYHVLVDPTGSGDIYVVGDFTNYKGTAINRIVRINSDGSIDNAFAVGAGFDGAANRIIPDIDSGSFYIGGDFANYNGTAASRIIRLNSTGGIEAAFVYGTGFNNIVYPPNVP